MPASRRPAFARRYAEPVEVERRDDAPAAFVRRGRRYLVRRVLAHWWETSAWWVADPGDGSAAARVGDDELELWRVEAAAVGGGGVSVVELAWSWPAARWSLVAVLD
jgi:hypothetical protein